MTSEERVAALRSRVRALENRRARRETAALSAGCGALGLCLILLIYGGSAARGGPAGEYAGAAMLFENAGGYVLLAVAAFMAGVIITASCIRFRKKREQEMNTNVERRNIK